MDAYMFALFGIAGIIAFRYALVHIQSRRAIHLASKKSVEHIMKCDYAFKVIHQLKASESELEKFRAGVIRILNQHEMYFEEYYKDFDFNRLWLDPTKWTLRQMYPHVCKAEVVKLLLDGKEVKL